MTPSAAETLRAPKVLLHDHLDGGLRPGTLIELADRAGHRLPAADPVALAAWYRHAAGASLAEYLETFEHAVAVLQSADALFRVAAECAEDLAADGVVYAESRFAPELHLERDLAPDDVVEAVHAGFREGEARAAEVGRRIAVRSLLATMRHTSHSLSVARLVVRWRHHGVVGFDLAGAEHGNPPTRHRAAFELLRREGVPFTIHAGEAAGLASIRAAVRCGAHRLGHAVRLVDDVEVQADGSVRLGALARHVRLRGIALEMCPSSNVQTGAVRSIAEHPIGLLARLGLAVTVSTDNRLVSGTSLTRELGLVGEAFGFDLDDYRRFAVDAARSAFLPAAERAALVDEVLEPGYAALRADRVTRRG